MASSVEKERFHLFVCLWIDANASVPLWLPSAFWRDSGATVTDGIAFEFYGVTSTITHAVSFLMLERVMTFGDQQQEPVSITDILHVGEAAFLAVSALAVAFGRSRTW